MNMQAMLKQAQQLQKQMTDEKNKIDNTEYVSESNLVKITMMGNYIVKSVEIKEGLGLDPEDKEMLEDMMLVALNDAVKKVNKATEDGLGKYTKGMSVPGLF